MAVAESSRRPDTAGRMKAYVVLGKLAFYDYYLAAFIVIAALPASRLDDPGSYVTLALYFAGYAGVVAASATLDDVTGIRDGSDERNYAPEQGALRDRSRKPLLSGALTVREAVRFAWAAALWALVVWSLTYATAPDPPGWAAVALLAALLSNLNYSYGLKLSYRGGQELLLLTPGLAVLLPFVLIDGSVSGLIVVESLLVGLWSLMVSIYSNINDLEGDRQVGRRNLATLTTATGYRRVVVAVHVLEPVTVGVAIAVGAVPFWFMLAMIPLYVMRFVQARFGLARGEVLRARLLGIKLHRWGVPVLIGLNVLIEHA